MASPNGALGIGGIMGGGGGGGGGGFGATGFSYAAGALTNAWAAYACTTNAADTGSDDIPDNCTLGALNLAFDTLAALAASIDVYLSETANGNNPLSHPVNVTFQLGLTAGRYVAALDLMAPYALAQIGTSGTVWVIAKTNVGTINFVGRLRWMT